MKGKWQAHERKLKGTSDYPWTAIETKMKSTIFEISLNISECCKQARYWVQTHMNTGPKSLRNLFQPGNTKPSKIVASISLTRLSSVRSQPSAMSNDKAAIPNDLAFWPTMPDPENKSRKTFDWPVCCKVSLTSCRYSAAPFFGLTHVLSASPLCASSSSSWDWHSGSLGAHSFAEDWPVVGLVSSPGTSMLHNEDTMKYIRSIMTWQWSQQKLYNIIYFHKLQQHCVYLSINPWEFECHIMSHLSSINWNDGEGSETPDHVWHQTDQKYLAMRWSYTLGQACNFLTGCKGALACKGVNFWDKGVNFWTRGSIFGTMVSIFGTRVSIFGQVGTWVSIFGTRVSTFWTRVSTFWTRVSTFWTRVSTFWTRVSTFWTRVSTFWTRVSTFWTRVSTFWTRVSTFWQGCQLFGQGCQLFGQGCQLFGQGCQLFGQGCQLFGQGCQFLDKGVNGVNLVNMCIKFWICVGKWVWNAAL